MTEGLVVIGVWVLYPLLHLAGTVNGYERSLGRDRKGIHPGRRGG